MEAQACGRPAIVSDNGGLPELVEDGKTGFIFKAGDSNELAHKIQLADETSFDTEHIVSLAREKYSSSGYLKKMLYWYDKTLKAARVK